MKNLPIKLILYATLTLVSVWLCFGHWDQIRERVISKVLHESTQAAPARPAPDPVDIPEGRSEAEPKTRLLGDPDEARESLAKDYDRRMKQRAKEKGTRPPSK